MNLKNYIQNKVFETNLKSLMNETSELLVQAGKYKREAEEQYDKYVKLCNGEDKQEIEVDSVICHAYDHILELHLKFERTFYRILQHKSLDKLKENLDFRLYTADATKSFMPKDSEDILFLNLYDRNKTGNLYTTRKETAEDPQWILVETITDREGNPIKNEQGEYSFQLPIEDRKTVEKFIPAFEEIMRRDENFDSLREAIKNIEETIFETKKFISNIEDETQLALLKLSEDQDSQFERELEDDLDKYIQLKNQI